MLIRLLHSPRCELLDKYLGRTLWNIAAKHVTLSVFYSSTFIYNNVKHVTLVPYDVGVSSEIFNLKTESGFIETLWSCYASSLSC